VVHAVQSALAQTLPPVEVIVVIDGPDESSAAALADMGDPRVRVLRHAVSQGPAAARNTGVRAATGDWIALLDDDDHWLPDKLRLQAEMAMRSPQAHPIISCRVIARTMRGDFVWPAHLPGGRQLGEYLIERRRPFGRPGYVATPTLLVRRETLLRVPFPATDDHEDWGWLLDAEAALGARVEMAEPPLCVVQVAENRPSRSKRNNWRASLDWALRYRAQLGPRALAALLLTKAAGKARRQGDWAAFPVLLAAAFRLGRPTPTHLVLFAGTWLLPAWGHRLAQAASFADQGTMVKGQ
jgi:glycosyltransferase involved in cell wall biosynthesis